MTQEQKNSELRLAWKKGQVWECKLLAYPNSPWELVGATGKAEPLWSNYIEYRQVEVGV